VNRLNALFNCVEYDGMADKLQSDQGEHARGVWTKLAKMALETEQRE
jgi:hypothetical protein